MSPKSPLTPLKVYLSSTYEDLKDYREAVYRRLRSLRHDVIAMEDYVATDQRPVDKCLKDVREADVYIGLFAWRYGYVPKGKNPRHLSITELELREAQKKGRPTLLFLLHDRMAWPPLMMDSTTGENDRGKRIQALRAELMSERLVSTFESPEELAAKALAALVTWQVDSSAEGTERPEPVPAGAGAEPRGDGTFLWKPGSTLRVRFLEKADTLGDRILRIAQIWNAYANIRFTNSTDADAEVRVAFSADLGSWSYVGTQGLDVGSAEPTMNLGWLKEDSPLEELERTVLHEFGHALGLWHEHNNPASTIKWDRQKVYDFYRTNQGWTKAMVDQTVFSNWPKNAFPFEKPFDPSSVMMYPVAPELLRERERVVPTTNLTLSAGDKAFVNRLYPYSRPEPGTRAAPRAPRRTSRARRS